MIVRTRRRRLGWMIPRLARGLAALVVGTTSGCGGPGPERVGVMGWVTVDGQQLEKGYITFTPAKDTVGPKAGGQIVDGEFNIDKARGPVVGDLRVEIVAEQDLGFELDDPEAFNEQVEEGWLPENPIPAKYNENSVLIVKATPEGPNEFDFQLRTK